MARKKSRRGGKSTHIDTPYTDPIGRKGGGRHTGRKRLRSKGRR